jgi:hypothetical protein
MILCFVSKSVSISCAGSLASDFGSCFLVHEDFMVRATRVERCAGGLVAMLLCFVSKLTRISWPGQVLCQLGNKDRFTLGGSLTLFCVAFCEDTCQLDHISVELRCGPA